MTLDDSSNIPLEKEKQDLIAEEDETDRPSDTLAVFWRASSMLLEGIGRKGAAFCLCPTDEEPPISAANLHTEWQDLGTDLTFPESKYALLLIRRHFGKVNPTAEHFAQARKSLVSGGLLYFDFVDASKSSGNAGIHPTSYWLSQLDEAGWTYDFWFEDDSTCHCLCSPDLQSGDLAEVGMALTSLQHSGAVRLEAQHPMRISLRGSFTTGVDGLRPAPKAAVYVFNPGAPIHARLNLVHRGLILLNCNRPLAQAWRIQQHDAEARVATDYRLRLPTGGTDLQLILSSDDDRTGEPEILEAVLDGCEPCNLDFTELAPDLYRRHRQAADILVALLGESGASILDVGGGNCILPQMLPEHRWEVADLYSVDHPAFLRNRWQEMEGHYDAVVSIDLLEHISQKDRPEFLAKLSMMGDSAVLAAPFKAPEIIKAENELDGLFSVLFKGGHRFLNEHLARGLPELETAVKDLQEGFPHYKILAGQSIRLWFISTALYCLAEEAPGGRFLAASYARAINENLDDQGESYRSFIVASKKRLPMLPEASRVKHKDASERLLVFLQMLIPLATLLRSTGNWRVESFAERLNERDLLMVQNEHLQKELKRVNDAFAELIEENSRVNRAFEELSVENSRINKAYEELLAEKDRTDQD